MKRLFTALVSSFLIHAVQADLVTHQLPENVSFQAVSWQGSYVVASGTAGGIFLSDDNGEHWQRVTAPKGTDAKQFRDNQRLQNGRLIVMSAGVGADSAIYITDDIGKNWQTVSLGTQKATFYDCFYMVNAQQGWLYGDSDKQGLFVLKTEDAGEHWSREMLPFKAQTSEGGFASSGTCLNAYDKNGIVIGTGNGSKSRVLIRNNNNWQSIESPIPGGEASGIFSVQSSNQSLFISGGSLKTAEQPAQAWLFEIESEQWTALPTLPLNGAAYGSAILPVSSGYQYWVSNPQGVAVLKPGANKWELISKSNIWSLACQENKGCIGVGKNGVIERYISG